MRATRDELIVAVREELDLLWNDLNEQIRTAINCKWSMGALNVRDRIVRLTVLVGPMHWSEVPMTLLIDGTYAEIHAAMGVEVEEVPPEEMENMREWKRKQIEAARS